MCVGFENGDFLGATCWNCRDCNCTASTAQITVRSAHSTQKEICDYNLTVGSSPLSRVRGSQISCGSVYDATTRPWYQTGKACGQRNGTQFGNMCVSDIYVFDGSFYMTFVQPFYDSNNSVLGVWGSDIRLDANGLSGLANTVMANVHQTEMTLVEHLGERPNSNL